MRQVFLTKGSIALKTVCEPLLHDNSVLVSVYHSLITPQHDKRKHNNNRQSSFSKHVPEKLKNIFESFSRSTRVENITKLLQNNVYTEFQPIGHSCSGRVIAVGKNVTKFRPGDYVACTGTGFAYHADVVCLPQSFVTHVTNKSHLQEAAFITLGTLAIDTVKQAQISVGDTVVVAGLDALGQLTAQIAKLAGCKVIGIDTNEHYLQVAQKAGIDAVYNPTKDNLQQEVSVFTNYSQADCTIITKDLDAILEESVNFTQRGGKILLSHYAKSIHVDYEKVRSRAVNLINIPYNTSFEEFLDNDALEYHELQQHTNSQLQKTLQTFIHFLEHGKITIQDLISHNISIQDTKQAFENFNKKTSLGVVLNFLPKPNLEKTHTPQRKQGFLPARKSSLSIGMLGKSWLKDSVFTSVIERHKNSQLISLVEPDVSARVYASQKYKLATHCKDSDALFEKNLDVLFINTRHELHAQQTMQALQAGKAVFVKTPMATNMQDLDAIKQLVTTKNYKFCVDYNLIFAPFIQKIKEQTDKRHTPMIIHYRMNAPKMSNQEIMKHKVGQGRLIGESCNVFDMLLQLIDSKPISLSVEALRPRNDSIFPTENFTAIISFDDGSLCTVSYCSIGHQDMSKERMEVHYDNKSIVMKDYLSLEGFGLPMAFNEHASHANDGRKTLMQRFLKAVHQKDPQSWPTNIEQMYTATHITLLIDQLAMQGGGEKVL